MAQVMTSGSRQPVVKRTPIVIEQLITPVIQTDSGTAQSTHERKSLQLSLVRHGETEWFSGQHTARTDLPLTPIGEQQARDIGRLFRGQRFGVVLTSPLLRARKTCRLAGYGDNAVVDPNLQEWDYGEYKGRTTAEIQEQRPGWPLWSDGVSSGESIQQVATRGQAVIDRVLAGSGDALLFAYGHILRLVACRWLGLPPQDCRFFALATAALTTLGYEHETRVITRLNADCSDKCDASQSNCAVVVFDEDPPGEALRYILTC
jgi:broad specificity phosphatase PhoE